MNLLKGDHVITPSGEEAFIVTDIGGGHFEVQYKYPINPENARLTLHGKLLRKYVPGLRLPRPARTGGV